MFRKAIENEGGQPIFEVNVQIMEKETKKERKKERKKEKEKEETGKRKGKGEERGKKKQCLTRTIFDAKSYRFRYHFISVRESAGTFHKMIRPFTVVHLCYDAISVS